LDTTTVLLLDVDPQSLHFEDDAVVFSSHLPQLTQGGRARMLAQLLASSAVARVLHHFQGLY
jgi:hypothetical protein